MSQESAKALTSSLGKLQIASKEKDKKDKLADSWEDEADDGESTPVRPSTSDIPGPPPPTPSSPTAAREKTSHYQSFPPFAFDGSSFDEVSASSDVRSSPRGDERRPDKTTAVASRLIAAGIGQKAPKRTQEQREYDQAMKVQEKKKRDEAKAEAERKKREKEQAQKDIWGD